MYFSAPIHQHVHQMSSPTNHQQDSPTVIFTLKLAFNKYQITYLEHWICIQDHKQHQHNSIHNYSSANSVNGFTKGKQ
jgi:hypothetical protein